MLVLDSYIIGKFDEAGKKKKGGGGGWGGWGEEVGGRGACDTSLSWLSTSWDEYILFY